MKPKKHSGSIWKDIVAREQQYAFEQKKHSTRRTLIDWLFDHWYCRYILVVLILAGAWCVGAYMSMGERWLFVVCMVLYVALLAYEVTLILLGMGLAYYLFGALAALPTSIAILIAAWAIAEASSSRK